MEDKILTRVQIAGRLLLAFNGKTVTKNMAKETPAEWLGSEGPSSLTWRGGSSHEKERDN